MKPMFVEVFNFGSYPHLRFDFSSVEGLNLIYGATGAGKSTFCDILPWCLFGVTAKDGNVDEIRSWQTPDEPTKGVLSLSSSTNIVRIRGKAGHNDLYWTEDGEEHRGRDLADTQRLIESRFHFSSAAFLTSSYFHEFSPTRAFWGASAKDRRKLFEGIAPLEFPAAIASKASEARKEAKKAMEAAEVALAGSEGRLKQAQESLADTKARLVDWDTKKTAKAEELATRAARFEVDRGMEIAKTESNFALWSSNIQADCDSLAAELRSLETKIRNPEEIELEIRKAFDQARCTTCKALPISANSGLIQLQQQKTENNYNIKYFEQGKIGLKKLETEKSSNPWAEKIKSLKCAHNAYLEQVRAIQAETNPFLGQAEKLQRDVKTLHGQVGATKRDKSRLERQVSSLTQLYDLSFELRGQLLQKAVWDIQEETNRYLEKYFDGEIKVSFSLESSDTLDVRIQKSGYDCVFRQLSKGQRQLLKLSFGVAVMETVGNRVGANNILFLDEALDGLDDSLKIKAHGLLTELESRHPAVFLIDHSPGLQNLLDRRYHVVLIGDISEMILES